jgi:hypothetical protein
MQDRMLVSALDLRSGPSAIRQSHVVALARPIMTKLPGLTAAPRHRSRRDFFAPAGVIAAH